MADKKRESSPPKRDEARNKQLALTLPAGPSVTRSRASRWGPPLPPVAPPPQWGAKGVWVPYPMAPTTIQRGGGAVGSYAKQTIFSRLSGQSSSSGTHQGRVITSRTLTLQESGKAPMRQVYIPKKVEALVKPVSTITPPTITIGSVEAPIVDDNERL